MTQNTLKEYVEKNDIIWRWTLITSKSRAATTEAHFLENHTYAMTQNNHEEYVEKNDISWWWTLILQSPQPLQ